MYEYGFRGLYWLDALGQIDTHTLRPRSSSRCARRRRPRLTDPDPKPYPRPYFKVKSHPEAAQRLEVGVQVDRGAPDGASQDGGGHPLEARVVQQLRARRHRARPPRLDERPDACAARAIVPSESFVCMQWKHDVGI